MHTWAGYKISEKQGDTVVMLNMEYRSVVYAGFALSIGTELTDHQTTTIREVEIKPLTPASIIRTHHESTCFRG